jgi:hypothetical protein
MEDRSQIKKMEEEVTRNTYTLRKLTAREQLTVVVNVLLFINKLKNKRKRTIKKMRVLKEWRGIE